MHGSSFAEQLLTIESNGYMEKSINIGNVEMSSNFATLGTAFLFQGLDGMEGIEQIGVFGWFQS